MNLIAIFPQLSAPLVFSIDILRVELVQVLHAFYHAIGSPRITKQMDMISHKTICAYVDAKDTALFVKRLKKKLIICFFKRENRCGLTRV